MPDFIEVDKTVTTKKGDIYFFSWAGGTGLGDLEITFAVELQSFFT